MVYVLALVGANGTPLGGGERASDIQGTLSHTEGEKQSRQRKSKREEREVHACVRLADVQSWSCGRNMPGLTGNEDEAAALIQAQVRGWLARRAFKLRGTFAAKVKWRREVRLREGVSEWDSK